MLGLPFLTIRGNPALRFDIPTLTLYAFGAIIPISQFMSVLLVVLFLSVIFIGATSILGRLWCGWLCPQSVLIEFAEDVSALISHRHRDTVKRIVLIPISILVSSSMLWYFIAPSSSLAAIASGGVAMWFFIVQAAVIYGMLALIGRRFCATVCPYSMLQSAFFDRDTVMVAYDVSRAEHCKGCDMCVRACPMQIDIKRGLQRECIACAKCIDACEHMTARRNMPSIVHYMGRPLRAKAAMWLALALVFGMASLVALSSRPQAEITLYRNSSQPPSGDVNTYTYSIRNETRTQLEFTLRVDAPFHFLGAAPGVAVSPNQQAKGVIVIAAPTGAAHPDTVRVSFEASGITISREAGYL